MCVRSERLYFEFLLFVKRGLCTLVSHSELSVFKLEEVGWVACVTSHSVSEYCLFNFAALKKGKKTASGVSIKGLICMA